jgi:hypothetical protein
VTFNCGVAPLLKYGDVVELHRAADEALYRAKSEGHRGLRLAGPGQGLNGGSPHSSRVIPSAKEPVGLKPFDKKWLPKLPCSPFELF